MRKCFILFLVVLIVVLPVLAGNTIILDYDSWLNFYDLTASDENYNIWVGMYSYGGTEELYPIHVDSDLYDEKLLSQLDPEPATSEQSSESNNDRPDLLGSDVLPVAESANLSPVTISPGTESSASESISTMAVTVPTSGQSYIVPELIKVCYAPDADSGSLLAVLYDLLGKPVTSYTYKVRTSNSSSAYDGYLVQQMEYDANWLASLLLLLVVLYCIFKAGGALLCRT